MTDLQTTLTWLKSANSLLFVFAPSENDNFCRIQRELFGDCEDVLRKHGLIMAEIFEQGSSHIGPMQLDTNSCDYFRRQFHITAGQSKVLLISKDQHIKLASDSFVSERELAMRLEAAAYEEPETAIS